MLSKYSSESYLDSSKAWEAAAKVAMHGLEQFPNDDMDQPYQTWAHNTILLGNIC